MAKEAYENYLNKIQNFDAFNNDDTAAREIENRKETKTIWGSLTKKEKTLITKYTETYSYLNEPLRGLPYSGARPPEDFKNDLKPLTNGIAKSITQREMVVRRGTDSFPIPELGGKELADIEIGEEFTDGGFLSTSVQKDRGFFKDIDMIIYIPKGMAGIYVEPFSHYTDSLVYTFEDCSTGKPKLWNGKKDESTGDEWEWIGQRGSRLRCIAKKGKTIYFQMLAQMQ